MLGLAAFLGDSRGLLDWVDNDARLPQDAAQLVVHLVVAAVVLGLVIAPAQRFVRREFTERRELRRRRVAALEALADEMNSQTPGGITDLVSAVAAAPFTHVSAQQAAERAGQ